MEQNILMEEEETQTADRSKTSDSVTHRRRTTAPSNDTATCMSNSLFHPSVSCVYMFTNSKSTCRAINNTNSWLTVTLLC